MGATRLQVQACLFDMDGLLINSEDIYTEVTNEILQENGRGPLPWEVKITLQGLPGPKAAETFLDWAQLPYSPEEYVRIVTEKQSTRWQTTQFMPGALELLQQLSARGMPIALATSSNTPNYLLKTAHLRHGFDLFGIHVVTGDDPRIPPGRGKPAPDIYLTALESLNADRRSQGLSEISPENCLVFEDGIPGVVAGIAAGCRVVWVPDPRALKVLNGRERTILTRGVLLRSLEDFDLDSFGC